MNLAPRRARWILAIGSLACSIMAVEVVLRAVAWSRDREEAQRLRSQEVITDGRPVGLGQLIRPCANDRLVYELIPGLSVEFVGVPVRVNSQGWRGPEPVRETAPGTIRVVGLGDSVMFGWGVRVEDTWLSLLADALEGSFGASSTSVINLAVPGYNTVMEVESLRAKGLRYEPDLVVIQFVPNDLGLPNFIRNPRSIFALRNWYLLRLVSRQPLFVTEPDLMSAPRTLVGEAYDGELERVPSAYRDLVGRQAWHRSMVELRRMADLHGFELVLLCGSPPDFVSAECSDLGIPVVSTQDVIWEYMQANGIEQYLGSALTLTATDAHPSPIGHQLAYEAIWRYLSASGWLSRIRMSRQPGA